VGTRPDRAAGNAAGGQRARTHPRAGRPGRADAHPARGPLTRTHPTDIHPTDAHPARGPLTRAHPTDAHPARDPLARVLARALAGALAALGLLVGALALAAPAAAEPPGRLPQPVTDAAGVLGDQADEVDAALRGLADARAIQLWVAYVDSFDGLGGTQWAQRTADVSGLGGNDLLFAVAVGDREYGFDISQGVGVSDAELDRVLAEQVEPELRDSDWAGAAIALADGLSDTGSAGGSGSMGWLPLIAGIAALVGGAVLVAALVRRGWSGAAASRGGAAVSTGPAPAPIDEVRKQVAAALIEVDDSVKTSEQELGFAIAQFGDEAAAPFTAALAQSNDELKEAFALQRDAQDAAETPAERGMLERILELCRSADERLDAQVAAFDELRDLERTVDSLLPELEREVQALTARLEEAIGTAEGLKARWPQAALAPVTADLDETLQRITFARESAESGTTALAAGDRSGAVAHARAAEEGIAQAGALLDGVQRAPEVLASAERAITELLAETERDIAEAERLGVPAEVASAHTYASDTLGWARSVMQSGNYDPIATRRALEESDSALERGLVPLREAAESRRRAEALLASATDAARASIQAADDFITTRRGAIGAEARTRLAAAQREFAAGQAGGDPVAALGHMQSADHLADQAHALAQQDEARYRNAAQMGGGSGNLGTIVLGGILINSMTRGGRRGGFGSVPRGGMPRGGSRGPGSFGGAATRARRSGGGRF